MPAVGRAVARRLLATLCVAEAHFIAVRLPAATRDRRAEALVVLRVAPGAALVPVVGRRRLRPPRQGIARAKVTRRVR